MKELEIILENIVKKDLGIINEKGNLFDVQNPLAEANTTEFNSKIDKIYNNLMLPEQIINKDESLKNVKGAIKNIFNNLKNIKNAKIGEELLNILTKESAQFRSDYEAIDPILSLLQNIVKPTFETTIAIIQNIIAIKNSKETKPKIIKGINASGQALIETIINNNKINLESDNGKLIPSLKTINKTIELLNIFLQKYEELKTELSGEVISKKSMDEFKEKYENIKKEYNEIQKRLPIIANQLKILKKYPFDSVILKLNQIKI
jgi:hypothetical protein